MRKKSRCLHEVSDPKIRFILKALGSFGGFKLGDGVGRCPLAKVTLTPLWKLVPKGKTGIWESSYETRKVNKIMAVMVGRRGGLICCSIGERRC